MSAKQDDDLMDTLTDEEREAMADDGMSDEDRNALAAVAGDADPAKVVKPDDAEGDDEDDDGEDDEDDDDDDDSDAAGADAGEGAQAGQADEATQAADAGQAAQAATEQGDDLANAINAEIGDKARLVQYDASLPADYEQRTKALSDKQAEINRQFNEGDIDLAERDQALGEIQAERENLLMVRARTEALAAQNEQNARALWQSQIDALMTQAKRPEMGGIDYRTDEAKARQLDRFVKTLAGDDENADKDGAWFLAEAHKLVLARYNITPQRRAAVNVPTDPKTVVANAKASRKPALSDVPQNLASVPGSDGPGDVASEFADIEALEGQELEDAIARMSPAQREKFLKG